MQSETPPILRQEQLDGALWSRRSVHGLGQRGPGGHQATGTGRLREMNAAPARTTSTSSSVGG
jgi:hypothetical protein